MLVSKLAQHIQQAILIYLQNIKQELASYGMDVSGAKMALVERLYNAYKSKAIPEPVSDLILCINMIFIVIFFNK